MLFYCSLHLHSVKAMFFQKKIAILDNFFAPRCFDRDVRKVWPSVRVKRVNHSMQKINGYRSDIPHRRTDVSPVAKYFNSGAHSELNMMVMVIELSLSCDPCLQKVKEGRWIRTLETLLPSEMNVQVDSLTNLCLPSPSVHPWVSLLSFLMSFPSVPNISILK